MNINQSKTKEMLICFNLKANLPSTIMINDEPINRIKKMKLLGVFIQDDLQWTEHINYIQSKASSKLYYIINLRRAGVNQDDLIKIYTATIRSVLEYACPLWHGGINDMQSKKLEYIQERVTLSGYHYLMRRHWRKLIYLHSHQGELY